MARSEKDFTLAALLAGSIGQAALPAVRISGLSLDSRQVAPGNAFFALAGSRGHGLLYAEQALAKGAAALVYEPAQGGEMLAEKLRRRSAIPCLPMPSLAQRMGFIASRFFGEPSFGLEVIGITGTNGKTSCSYFLSQALSPSMPCAVIGTLGWGFEGRLRASEHTTPHALATHAILAAVKREGAKAVAMEVSSHGQVQGRVNGVRFKGALYTNISRDHLDYHGSMEAYIEAKSQLLQSPDLEFAVINLDDGSASRLLAAAPLKLSLFGYSRRPAKGIAALGAGTQNISRVWAEDIRHDSSGLTFRACFKGARVPIQLAVWGDFNVENALGALTVLLALGFSLPEGADLISRIRPVAGRMERFAVGERGPVVVVDYAHTPHALESVLRSLKAHCQGKLWVVFGCGGERDRGKRPQMGRIAERWADYVVITDDNPRAEAGEAIVEDILSGCERRDIQIIRQRRQAIEAAIEQAQPEDIVLVAGKGHEAVQQIGSLKYPFSDRLVVQEALRARQEVA